jgi:enterochelin esterase-like enzyme
MSPIGRRALTLGTVAAVACSRTEPASGDGPTSVPLSSNVRLLEWDFGQQPWGQARAVVAIPAWGDASTRYPVLVALHGRGEALKAPPEGAMGWPRDYAMIRAMDRLRSPPLREADYQGFVDRSRMATTNASLSLRPFGGVIVACPWLPDFHPAMTVDISTYSRFVTEMLMPRVWRETPAIANPEATGIDGVSLGGVIALRIGLARPESFGAVGGIQPALLEGQNIEWTAMAQAARARHPTLKLRLLTSREDYFRAAIVSLSQAWNAAGIGHDFVDVPGPHDYVFNRGPGSIELLLWHDRVLARS